MSYIVMNCPTFDSKYNECHSKNEPHKLYCQDCTDCVIKQVIDKCKEHPFKDCACGDDILQLFNIEEINK